MATAKKKTTRRTSQAKTVQHNSSPTPKSDAPKQDATPQKTPDTKQEEIKPKQKIGLKLNWNRAIHINTNIDDKLLRDLTPVILQMKQESSEPITVGIDSPGGTIPAIESLLGLLKSPDQDGNYPQIYTVATNRAYSAAASLLAFGDYSVAFNHSKILYHDVRYSGIEDVTPSKALKTARELERGNVAFSLKLAHQIRSRLIWVYLDLMHEFKDIRAYYASYMKPYDEAFKEFLPQKDDQTVDIVGFSLTLFRKLSNPVDNEIAIRALNLLNSWMQIERIERKLSTQNPEGEKPLDLVSGIDKLVTEIRAMEVKSAGSSKSPEPQSGGGLVESTREDVKLLFEVLARNFATNKNLTISDEGLDIIMEDFLFIKHINAKQHVTAITNMMIEYSRIFFGRSIAEELEKAKDITERNKILGPVYPQARILWYYIVLICRCLCRGEHFLTPADAQLLGLVDEVLGGGPVQSAREWRKSSPDYE